MRKENDEDKEMYLSFSNKELIDGQNNGTICPTMVHLINDKKVLSNKYFIGDVCSCTRCERRW